MGRLKFAFALVGEGEEVDGGARGCRDGFLGGGAVEINGGGSQEYGDESQSGGERAAAAGVQEGARAEEQSEEGTDGGQEGGEIAAPALTFTGTTARVGVITLPR